MAETKQPPRSGREEYEQKQTVGTYKVRAGIHREGGVTYGKGEEAGDIVESKKDLAKWDPQKFVDLDEGNRARAAKKSKSEEEDADESPVSDENAQDAIDQISRMRSKERLQEIAANDKRSTVKQAAQKRLQEL